MLRTPETPSRAPLTTSAVARLLGVSDATVRARANRGELRAERTAGGIRLFDPTDVALELARLGTAAQGD